MWRLAIDASTSTGNHSQSFRDAFAARRLTPGVGRAHVTQKGSLVAPDRLRFDFSHFKPVSREELAQIETLVNAEVRRNEQAEVRQMAYDDAIAFGAMALFGEKYGDEVRVLKMGEFSTELCGGTHVARTGDIGLFKIVSEAGVASGVRRIEAVTGAGALVYVADEERRLSELSQLLSSSSDDAAEKLRQLFDRQKKLERELESLRAKAVGSMTSDLAGSARMTSVVSKLLRHDLKVSMQKRCATVSISSSSSLPIV